MNTQSISTSSPSLTDAYYRGFPVTTVMTEAITTHTTSPTIPTYRVMDESGVVIDPEQDPQVQGGSGHPVTIVIQRCIDC